MNVNLVKHSDLTCIVSEVFLFSIPLWKAVIFIYGSRSRQQVVVGAHIPNPKVIFSSSAENAHESV